MNKRLITIFSLMMVFALALTACAPGETTPAPGGEGDPTEPPAETATIRIGSKQFTEQNILGYMYQLLLEDAGFNAVYTPLGSTAEAHQAIINDEIDIYPEYTGTGLLTILEGEFDSSMTADVVYDTVQEAYNEQFGLTWLEPTGFNNTYCLTMPEDQAEEMGIETVSDLSQNASGLIFGTSQEFVERADGLPGLQEVYGGFDFQEVVAVDPGLLYVGIREGEIDVTTCFGTDGQIAAYNLRVLEDDMNFWPPYPAAPVVRTDVLEANPGIAEALNPLAALLDNEAMSGLNWEVAGDGREADEVARDFLVENGLIEG